MLSAVELKKRGSEIYNYARFNGFTNNIAKYVVAQSAHETNGFTSFIFNNNNNAFGMTYAKQINASGQQYGYATYATLAASVKDLAVWFGKRFKGQFITSLSLYVQFLKNNRYFTDKLENYITGCEYWYKKIYG